MAESDCSALIAPFRCLPVSPPADGYLLFIALSTRGNPMQLFVKTLTGQFIVIDVESTDSIQIAYG